MLLRCYFTFVLAILEYYSLVWGSAAECHHQLLERQVCSMVRLCPDQCFLLCHRRRVAGLSMLYKVNSNSNHCLFSELLSASTRVRHTRAAAAVNPLEVEVSRYITSQFARCLVLAQVRMWNYLPHTVFDTGTQDRFWAAVTVGCIPELCLQFSVAQVLMGLREQFINNFIFPTFACAAGFNNNNNNNQLK